MVRPGNLYLDGVLAGRAKTVALRSAGLCGVIDAGGLSHLFNVGIAGLPRMLLASCYQSIRYRRAKHQQ